MPSSAHQRSATRAGSIWPLRGPDQGLSLAWSADGKTLAAAWTRLETAWKAENVLEANQAIEEMAGGIASINAA
ncbi:hypothetical protein LCGC14_3133230, partial [marine sediment metagenome]